MYFLRVYSYNKPVNFTNVNAKKKLKRRDFIKQATTSGFGYMALFACPAFSGNFEGHDKCVTRKPNPEELNYCGYKCPDDCPFLKGTLENNIELKKKAYKEWKIKERFNISFDENTIFCFGCKNEEKPAGIVLQRCTVRECVMGKELDCCIECDELSACNKELWQRYPDFKKKVIKMQKMYQAG